MASNIKIVGNILNTTEVFRYSNQDINLIPSTKLNENFGGENDYIEFYIYDAAGNLLNISYNYFNYKLPTSTGLTPGTLTPPNTTGNIQTENVGVTSTLVSTTGSIYPVIEIDPIQDLQNTGYSSGEFNTRYNLFTNILSNSVDKALFIKEISQDRTEIRLGSISLTDAEIETTVLSIIDEIDNSSYYVDYLLNFGNNIQILAINIALNKAPEGYEVLFKLYEPLPVEIQEKMTLWVVKEKSNPYVFDINLDKFITPLPDTTLRGPNFSIDIPNQGTVSTTYTTYSTALASLQTLQSSSYNQLMNLMNTQSIQINVDYTDFNNFVFFGSAYKRLSNFYTKVKQIENYTGLINKYTPYVATTASLQNEINSYSSSISTLISQFDGYESYLYFESSSYTWPKSSSIKPFSLLSTGSATAITWYNNLTGSAKDYDLNNYDNLEYTVPSFIKDDGNNTKYLTFLNMVGQYFDNIWIYLKAITDINLANNNLNKGISKDLVYNQLQSLGIKLYNSQAGNSVANYLIGANTGSIIFNDNFSVTSSFLNNIPRKDLVSELYKRIYHNLPLLLKTKGTVAGLEYLISTFGIQNQTYYASGSETIYTPFGSNFTSSILNVKEYGGSLKGNLIKGYNNEKVRIVQNTITGSVLSPLLSLQTYPTASSQFRENDMHYVDISFSPETQMDTYISKSIASNNPTWNLDNYIGDPRQQYYGSYPDLDAQRKLYFQTGVSGFTPFTGSSLDYNGFIRLIQYFDNSLFKMLEDFVPERTSLSTGITINSPVLERNKVTYANPTNTITQSNQTARYDIADINSTYGTFYNTLSSSNNTMGWFDGELSGSIVDVNQYFEDNYNPYLGDWSVWNAQHSSTQSINLNSFIHSDWNVLLNNISSSVKSIYRNNIEYVYGTTRSITYPAELQDSYLSLYSYNTSRYDGVKTTSLLYNTYTSASGDYDGDYSFGKAAAIDHYVRKIGIFTQIQSSSFLPNRNAVSLKYFIDEFGNLTELNQLNKNWCDLQRTFILGDIATVAQFDNRKFANQKTTDGDKVIFDSGYTYTPVLYFSTCSLDPVLAFINEDNPDSNTAIAKNSSTSYYISGSNILNYPLSSSYVMNLFNLIQQGDDVFKTGSLITFPSYTVKETTDYRFVANVPVTISTPPSVAKFFATWSLQVWVSGSTRNQLIKESYDIVKLGDPATATLTWDGIVGGYFHFTISEEIPSLEFTGISLSAAQIQLYYDNAGTCEAIIPPQYVTMGRTTLYPTAPGATAVSFNGTNDLYTINAYSFKVNGTTVVNGGTITLGGTLVTISIPTKYCAPGI